MFFPNHDDDDWGSREERGLSNEKEDGSIDEGEDDGEVHWGSVEYWAATKGEVDQLTQLSTSLQNEHHKYNWNANTSAGI